MSGEGVGGRGEGTGREEGVGEGGGGSFAARRSPTPTKKNESIRGFVPTAKTHGGSPSLCGTREKTQRG